MASNILLKPPENLDLRLHCSTTSFPNTFASTTPGTSPTTQELTTSPVTTAQNGETTSTESPRNNESSSSGSDDGDTSMYIIIGAAVGGIVLIFIVVLICFCICRRRNGNNKPVDQPQTQPNVYSEDANITRENVSNIEAENAYANVPTQPNTTEYAQVDMARLAPRKEQITKPAPNHNTETALTYADLDLVQPSVEEGEDETDFAGNGIPDGYASPFELAYPTIQEKENQEAGTRENKLDISAMYAKPIKTGKQLNPKPEPLTKKPVISAKPGQETPRDISEMYAKPMKNRNKQSQNQQKERNEHDDNVVREHDDMHAIQEKPHLLPKPGKSSEGNGHEISDAMQTDIEAMYAKPMK